MAKKKKRAERDGERGRGDKQYEGSGVRRIKYSCKQQLLLRRRRNGKDGGMEVSLGCGDELRVNKHLARCVCMHQKSAERKEFELPGTDGIGMGE